MPDSYAGFQCQTVGFQCRILMPDPDAGFRRRISMPNCRISTVDCRTSTKDCRTSEPNCRTSTLECRTLYIFRTRTDSQRSRSDSQVQKPDSQRWKSDSLTTKSDSQIEDTSETGNQPAPAKTSTASQCRNPTQPKAMHNAGTLTQEVHHYRRGAGPSERRPTTLAGISPTPC